MPLSTKGGTCNRLFSSKKKFRTGCDKSSSPHFDDVGGVLPQECSERHKYQSNQHVPTHRTPWCQQWIPSPHRLLKVSAILGPVALICLGYFCTYPFHLCAHLGGSHSLRDICGPVRTRVVERAVPARRELIVVRHDYELDTLCHPESRTSEFMFLNSGTSS